MEFLTLADYKAIKNIKAPTQDVELGMYVDASNALVTDYLGYKESTTPEERMIFMMSGTEILDDYWASITSVVTADADEPLAFTLRNNYILTLNPIYIGDVKITGTLKSNTTNPALRLAVVSLVDYYLKDQYLKSISSSGGDSIALPTFTSIPPHIKSVLDLYRVL